MSDRKPTIIKGALKMKGFEKKEKKKKKNKKDALASSSNVEAPKKAENDISSEVIGAIGLQQSVYPQTAAQNFQGFTGFREISESPLKGQVRRG